MRRHVGHLAALEAESTLILREAVAECPRPVLLFSGGKDSAVLRRLRAVRAALRGEIERFAGVSDPYEERLAPEVVDSSRESVEESAARPADLRPNVPRRGTSPRRPRAVRPDDQVPMSGRHGHMVWGAAPGPAPSDGH